VLADAIPAQARPIARRVSTQPVPQYTWLANLTGGPAVSVPCGLAEGLPVGFQLTSLPGRDRLVMRVARAYEVAAGHLALHPPLYP
jgi:Asp-tRNA(Asn)/Glu-tRNA(Gln) amidotransferase A subunit family amidase